MTPLELSLKVFLTTLAASLIHAWLDPWLDPWLDQRRARRAARRAGRRTWAFAVGYQIAKLAYWLAASAPSRVARWLGWR